MRQLLLYIILFSTLLSCSTRESIFIDGLEQSRNQLENLDSTEIFSITKYPPGLAPERYDKGKDTTVIVVKTKQVETILQKQRHALLKRFLDSVDNGADILIVEDGILVKSEDQQNLRDLPPNELSSAYTMEWNAAKSLYGSPARPITLVINLYNPRYKRQRKSE